MASNLSAVPETKLLTPGSNTFIGVQNASLGHREFNVSKTQGKTKVQPNALVNDCRWIALALV